MIKFDEYLEKQLENEELKREYDKLDSEFANMQEVIDKKNTEQQKFF